MKRFPKPIRHKAAYMKKNIELTALIEKDDGGGYTSLCPDLDIASQGETIEKAKENLVKALELFFETASEQAIKDRLRNEVFITRIKVSA